MAGGGWAEARKPIEAVTAEDWAPGAAGPGAPDSLSRVSGTRKAPPARPSGSGRQGPRAGFGSRSRCQETGQSPKPAGPAPTHVPVTPSRALKYPCRFRNTLYDYHLKALLVSLPGTLECIARPELLGSPPRLGVCCHLGLARECQEDTAAPFYAATQGRAQAECCPHWRKRAGGALGWCTATPTRGRAGPKHRLRRVGTRHRASRASPHLDDTRPSTGLLLTGRWANGRRPSSGLAVQTVSPGLLSPWPHMQIHASFQEHLLQQVDAGHPVSAAGPLGYKLPLNCTHSAGGLFPWFRGFFK